jgi:hypothetical protein
MPNALVQWIYDNPIWLVACVFVAGALSLATAGVSLVHAVTPKRMREQHGELSSFVANNVAVLYAVLLAFIAVATWESFTKASELVDAEANLAGNLYRDTHGLPEPAAGEIRRRIQAYLQAVIQQEWPRQQDGVMPDAGLPILDRVQDQIVAIAPRNAREAVLMQEILHVMNELYAARMARLDAVSGHVPEMVWTVLVAIGALTIGYACFVRSDGLLVHLIMLGGLTTALTLVVALIVELDYPFRGSISVSSEAYRLVLARMSEVAQSEP